MYKRVLMKKLFIIISMLSDDRVSYNAAQNIISKVIHQDTSFINDIRYKPDYMELYEDFTQDLYLLSDGDKKIIVDNLVKEFYLMIEYEGKAYDTSLPYRERQRSKYQAVLKSLTIKVLLIYIEDGISIKDEFNAFKNDYKKYAENLGIICDFLEAEDKEGLMSALEYRAKEAEKLIGRYKIFDISDTELRSMYEYDQRFTCVSSIPKEIEIAFGLAEVV